MRKYRDNSDNKDQSVDLGEYGNDAVFVSSDPSARVNLMITVNGDQKVVNVD